MTPDTSRASRRPYRDIDLIAYSSQKREIAALFEERGYVLDPSIRLAEGFGIKRFVRSAWHRPQGRCLL